MKEVVSLEKSLQVRFDGEVQCGDVDLVEALPPLVSGRGIEATFGSNSATGTGENPNLQDIVVTSASQKDLTPSGSSRSLRRVKRCFAFLEADRCILPTYFACLFPSFHSIPLHNSCI